MKNIKTFADRNNLEVMDYSSISNYIREEIELGKCKPYEIEHNLYKSGDYICSSFKINDRDVIVSSIVISDEETKCPNGGRHYKTLNDYLLQFNINANKYLFVGFGEHSNGNYNNDENVNDNETLFRKMATIIEIIKSMVNYHRVNFILLSSIQNDLRSGLKKNYNKRDKFYELFLVYNNIKYHKIKENIDINGELISNFFILEL